MKGKIKQVEDKLALYLEPENNLEKKWLLNAFYCISPGVLGSTEGNIESLVLWTDNNHKCHRLPRNKRLS